MPDLTITPDSAYAILLVARRFDAKVAGTDPDSGSNPSDDRSIDTLEFAPHDDTQHELVSAINDLNDDEQRDLIALILIGRGDYLLAQWASARQTWDDIGRAHVAQFVYEIPLVSDFLEDGLSYFNLSLGDYIMSSDDQA